MNVISFIEIYLRTGEAALAGTEASENSDLAKIVIMLNYAGKPEASKRRLSGQLKQSHGKQFMMGSQMMLQIFENLRKPQHGLLI